MVDEGLKLQAVATPAPGKVTDAGFGLEALLDFRWQLTLDGAVLDADEIAALAEAKRPLIRLRGRWVILSPALLDRLRRPPRTRMRTSEALGAVLAGEAEIDGETVAVVADGPLADLAEVVRKATTAPRLLEPPPGLRATLRPYQQNGLAWLVSMCDSGLGGCLADDMGLGKTIQVIALHLHRRDAKAGPTLVVCPTSLLGTWEREIRRFAPELPVRRYHGGGRHLQDLAVDEVVLVTYGVVLRDSAMLAEADWGLVVADEAQHAKNPLSRTARELRAIPAPARIALTGTPVVRRRVGTQRTTGARPNPRHRPPLKRASDASVPPCAHCGAIVFCVAAVIYVTAGPVLATAWLPQPHAPNRVVVAITRLAGAEARRDSGTITSFRTGRSAWSKNLLDRREADPLLL